MKNIFYIVIFFFISCDDTPQNSIEQNMSKPLLSVAKEHSKIVPIKPNYKKETENWEGLNTLNSFMSRFSKISPNEALSNALELKDLVKSLKDSVMPTVFDIPSFHARINVLDNEVLRLVDLTYIAAITAEDVHQQIDKTLASFSAVNSKINAILSQKSFEDDIAIDVSFIGIDTTRIDSVSKKSIDKKINDNILFDKKKIEKKGKNLNGIKSLKEINKK